MAKSKIGKMNKVVYFEQQDNSTRDAVGGFLDTWFPALNTVSKDAESGTSTTTLKIALHNLMDGDYIVNATRGNALRAITVVDSNTVTVETVAGQTIGDTINLHRHKTSKVWARFENKFQTVFGDNQQRKTVVRSTLTIRKRSDISKEYRVKMGDRTFEILSFFDIDEAGRYMSLGCREVL